VGESILLLSFAQQKDTLATHQSDQPFGVENELVSARVAVPDEGVQAADLRRRRKNLEGLGQRLAGAVVRQLAAKLEAPLAQLVLVKEYTSVF
jgi:hypothetical protein